MNTLGISAFYHDSAAAIIKNGDIVAAAQEERFTRRKQDAGFPINAIKYCLDETALNVDSIDSVVFYEEPQKKFQRLIKTYLGFAPQGYTSFMHAMPMWLTEKLYQKRFISKQLSTLGEFDSKRLSFSEHHLSHAASAFYPSPFEKAAILVVDGVGENATTTIASGDGNQLELVRHINFPHSLGMLYAAFTHYLGFKINSGEYKVMGLAPYGRPVYVDRIFDHLLELKPDGSFRLDQEYFDYCTGQSMVNSRFEELFSDQRRLPETELKQKHFDIAASIQIVTEEVMLAITREMAKNDSTGNLCLAGGVALNCVANGKILRDRSFESVWIQPAAGDAGSAVGAALVQHYLREGNPRTVRFRKDEMKGCYLGPGFEPNDVEQRLTSLGAVFEKLDEAAVVDVTTAALADEKVIGWFQGRMEFGPRALGNRSILGDPRSKDMQKTLNLKIKFRESFRPFAPSILEEDLANWFELDEASPYMLLVAEIKDSIKLELSASENSLTGLSKLNVPRSCIPAVTHVDYSARVQTVSKETNPLYHRLLSSFKAKTGCPILANTSFNVRGEPIVCTPEDAFNCFMTTDMDMLVVGNFVMHKDSQTVSVTRERDFEPD